MRHQARRANGRYTRNTIENTFGLHVIICPHCNILNPYGVGESKPEKCHACKKELEKKEVK